MAGMGGVYPKAGKTAFLLSISVLFMYLSQPGGPLPWLTWVALVPAGLSVQGCRPRRSAVILYLHGLGWWIVSTWWLMPAITHFAELKIHFSLLLLLLFCLLSALPYAVVGGLLGLRDWLKRPYGVAIVAAFYTVIISWAAGALPGNHAHGLYVYPTFIQIADLGGVPLVLFSVVFVNWQVVRAIHLLIEGEVSYPQCGVPVLKASILLLCIGLYGSWRMGAVDESQYLAPNDELQTLSIGFIQPNLVREDPINELFAMTNQLLTDHPDIEILIWPEIPTAFSYIESPVDRKRVDALVEKHKTALALVSGYVFDALATDENPAPRYYNAAHLIDAEGVLVESYYKQRLAPFYEYLPWEEQWPTLREWFPGVLRYRAGEKAKLFNFNEKIRIIPQICYEIVFSDLTGQMIKQGGNLIINFTNDYWLGDSRGSAYHFALGLFRAVEHKVPMVRATNTGISAIVDAAGRIQMGTETGLFVADSKLAKLSLVEIPTFYSVWGNLFLYLVTGISTTYLLLIAFYMKRNELKKCSDIRTKYP